MLFANNKLCTCRKQILCVTNRNKWPVAKKQKKKRFEQLVREDDLYVGRDSLGTSEKIQIFIKSLDSCLHNISHENIPFAAVVDLDRVHSNGSAVLASNPCLFPAQNRGSLLHFLHFEQYLATSRINQ